MRWPTSTARPGRGTPQADPGPCPGPPAWARGRAGQTPANARMLTGAARWRSIRAAPRQVSTLPPSSGQRGYRLGRLGLHSGRLLQVKDLVVRLVIPVVQVPVGRRVDR